MFWGFQLQAQTEIMKARHGSRNLRLGDVHNEQSECRPEVEDMPAQLLEIGDTLQVFPGETVLGLKDMRCFFSGSICQIPRPG